VSRAAATPAKRSGITAYWVLRAIESGLLLVSLVGIGLFAWSLVDILRIETAAVPTKELPASAWPGVFIFFGGMVLLQVVRMVLARYRRDDGTPRDDARGATAVTTTEMLASLDEMPATDATTDTETGA
jgi:TRAP-type C4-dicarboxylate transport system permease small subunit